MHLIQNFDKKPDDESIILLCVVRDEKLLLPAFVDHYQRIGVSHFVFVDNGSEDDTVECLLSSAKGVLQLWQTHDSYAENDYGLNWINGLLESECKDRWCVVVDADEFMMLNQRTLPEIRNEMRNRQQNIGQSVLVEFYPRHNDDANTVSEDVFNPLEHSNYYDSFQNRDYYFTDTAPDNSFILKGGMRQRVFWNEKMTTEAVCLSKKSFFQYTFADSHRLSAGMHWLLPLDFKDWSYLNWDHASQNLCYHQNVLIIAHFKFVRADLNSYFETRLQRNQDWNNSEEYRIYLRKKQSSYFDKHISHQYTTTEKLYNDTINFFMKSV